MQPYKVFLESDKEKMVANIPKFNISNDQV